MARILGLILMTIVLGLAAGGASGAAARHGAAVPTITHGVIVGDVTTSSALLWARADREATLNAVLSGGRHGRIAQAPARAVNDFTARIPLAHLAPGTTYRYRAWFSLGSRGSSHGPPVEGSFHTAPERDTAAPLRLAFGGDLNGQNVCRDSVEGMPIMDIIRARRPDVFVGLGDIIYADNACAATGLYGNAQVPGDFGPAADLATYRAHWRYSRADTGFQRLLERTDYVGVWDDHEVVNDFGPLSDTRSTPPYTPGVHLLPIGLEAFLDYTPVAIAENTPSAPLSLDPLGQEPGADRARHPPVPRRELRRGHRQPAQDDARARAAHLAEGKARSLRRDLEGDRFERADVDPDRLPADERTGRVGELRPDDGL